MWRWLSALFIAWPRIFWDYFFCIKKYKKHKEKYPLDKRFKKVKKLLQYVSKRLKVEIFIEGLENIIPNQSQLIVSNHLSSFDALGTLCVMEEPTTFVSKIEVENMIFVGNIVRVIEGLFMDRTNLKQSLKVMMAVQKDLSENNKNWIIYPEGTRNRDELALIQDFHAGTFRAAVKSEVNIVPIAIYGSQRVLKLDKYKKHPLHISILKPLTPKDTKDMSTDEIAKRCKDDIQRELSFNLRRKDHEYMITHNKKHYKFNEII